MYFNDNGIAFSTYLLAYQPFPEGFQDSIGPQTLIPIIQKADETKNRGPLAVKVWYDKGSLPPNRCKRQRKNLNFETLYRHW